MAVNIGDIADELTASDEVKSKPIPLGPLPERSESEEKSPSRDSHADSEPLISNGHSQSGDRAPIELLTMASVSRQYSMRDSALAGTLAVNGKTCDVNLSEDKITWKNRKGKY